MGLSDETKPSSPVGALSTFKVIKDSGLISSGDTHNKVLTDMWAARGGLPFRLPSGKSTKVIFLADFQLIPVHEIAIGERKGATGKYPQTDFIRSTSVLGLAADGTSITTGKECLIEKALGRAPKIVAVTKLVDLTGFKTKKGVQVPWSVRTIIIPGSSPVLNTLSAASEVSGKDMQYAMFLVARSLNEKSPKIGDSWTYSKHMTATDIMSEAGLQEAANKVDMDKGFPVISDESIKFLLKRHKILSDKYSSENKNAVFTYDERAMAEILGMPIKPTVTSGGGIFGSSGVAANAPSSGIQTTKTSAFGGLEELDDIPDGNPFDGLDVDA